MNAKGTTRSPSRYKDGTESFEICFDKDHTGDLPAKEGHRVPFNLLINGETYEAGVRMTKKCPVVWICPDTYDSQGKKRRLSDLLRAVSINKNETIRLWREGDAFVIYRSV